MKLEFIEEEIFYNVGIGHIFKCKGAFWVCLNMPLNKEKYPSMCIKVGENIEVNVGDEEYFDDNEKIEIYGLTK